MSRVVIIDYTNYQGVRADRRILPISVHFETNTFHPGPPQWFMFSEALDRDGAKKMFAMKDIHSWKQEE